MITTRIKSGYLYKIPINEIEYVGYFYGNKGKEKVKSAYSRLTTLRGRAPDFLLNAELFDFDTRKPASAVVDDGKTHLLTEGFGIGFVNNQKPVFSYKNNVNAPDYIGAYPPLVRNKKIEGIEPSGTGGSRGRTALGTDDNNFYIALIPDGSNDVTIRELSQAFLNAGAVNAIGLDGGGSTQYYSPLASHFTTRPVRGFIGVWLRKANTTTTPSSTTKSSTAAATPKADVRTVSVKTSLRIRNKPSTITGKVVGKLYNGNKVNVLRIQDGWCQIAQGWVSASYLKK